ncbi:MAG: hypothetical protein KDA83_12315, partial [Planctomycetales bacterium]|nr:hypothetical protein [Planctomycetales bacterium]
SLPALRDRLAEQGIRIESFEVDLYQDPSNSQEFAFDQPRQRNRERPSSLEEMPEERNASPHRTSLAGPGGLDVIV